VFANKGERVVLWTRQSEHARDIQETRENRRLFPGFALPETVDITSSVEQALPGADAVVLALPTTAVRQIVEQAAPHLPEGVPVVTASKGIESSSLMLMSEVIEDVLGPTIRDRCAFLSGPSFAKEVAEQMPTTVVMAATNYQLSEALQQRFATERLRIYASDDPIGVQVGGALKNVIAIAAGACDGLGFGHNTRAALITRGLAEIARLAIAKGGNVLSLAGLAGLGDLVLTCNSDLSRNRTLGFEMARGRKPQEALAWLGHVAEGAETAKSAYRLAETLGVELPICAEVYQVLYEGKPPARAVQEVLSRPLKREWG
jgi:glycerol-3-phosphate dehydrogenase (NAD(P)+)